MSSSGARPIDAKEWHTRRCRVLPTPLKAAVPVSDPTDLPESTPGVQPVSVARREKDKARVAGLGGFTAHVLEQR